MSTHIIKKKKENRNKAEKYNVLSTFVTSYARRTRKANASPRFAPVL